MRFKYLALVVLLFVLSERETAAGQAPKIKESKLESTPISAGPLRVKLLEYRGSFLKVGNGSVRVEVENGSDEFAAFSPHLLSFVGSDHRQADVLAIQAGTTYWTPVTRNIAPAAKIEEFYSLTAKIKLPARLFYDGKLIAEIIE